MAKKKPRTLKVGANGEVKLPPDALEAIEWQPGEEVEIVLDTRHKRIVLERHVEDAWAEALKPKPEKGFEDILGEQAQRDKDAKELFERRLKETKPGKRDPEDDRDRWR
jgi:bifunctional DNA-binding transcriptional regulator/antitoxin component of YhaV-PrlF toxin-antitoxin module